MRNFEYSDLYKFLVSLGMVLLISAFLIPYTLFKTDFGLNLTPEEFDGLREVHKNFLLAKESYIFYALDTVSRTASTLFGLGLICVFYGLIKWSLRQRVVDSLIDTDLELKKLNLDEFTEDLTPEEIDKKAEEEVRALSESTEDEEINNIRKVATKAIEIEEKVINQIKTINSDNFELKKQILLDNRYGIDLLMRAKKDRYLDRLIEIKYMTNNYSKSAPANLVKNLVQVFDYYRKNIRKAVIPVIIIVVPENLRGVDESTIRYLLREELNKLIPDKRVKYFVIRENEIGQFDPNQIISR